MEIINSIELAASLPSMPFIDITNLLREDLNNLVKQKEYGSGIHKCFIVIRIVEEFEKQFKYYQPIKRFNKAKKEVVVSDEIDIERFNGNDQNEFLTIICLSTIKALVKIKELKIKNFQIDDFIQDVKLMFEAKNYISDFSEQG
jgi:hypothetical protein